MTCIVGIEYGGKAYIGGDIQGSAPNHKIIHTQPKVFLRNGVAFGFTSSYRFGQIIEHEVKDPFNPPKEEVYKWLVTCLVPSIKKSLEDNGFTEGGTCLIGVRGELWRMESNFAVLRSVLGYDSVGSGYEYALGSVYSQGLKLDPVNTVKRAIDTAGTFCPTVGKESFIVVS